MPGAPNSGDLRADLVRVVRALSRLGLADLRVAASLRLPTGEIVATPRPGAGAPVPAALSVDDLVTLDPDGRPPSGSRPAPRSIPVDLEIYRRRPDVHAVLHGQPLTALAFAAAGQPLRPLTHTEAVLVHPRLPILGTGAVAGSPREAAAVADGLADRPVALLTGNGSVAVGSSIAEAGMLTHQVELLAKVNEIAALHPTADGAGRTVAEVDSARISAQKAPAADFQDYFDQVAARPDPTPDPDPTDDSEAGIRGRIVAACQLLYQHGLIQSLEHLSVRIPEQDAFLMTPRRHLGKLLPGEIAVVGMDGQWRSGPLPPPPFLWLHRDIFAARPEVLAIVHTHQLLVRALLMAGTEVRPLYRGGAGWAATPAAIHETPDLMFDPDQRKAAMAVLGSARVLHEVSHGSDFLAATVEEATAGALHLERQARLWHLAARLGNPRPLGDDVLARIPEEEPTDLDWWRYFRSELPSGSGRA
jgi:ribulose-5-phosphate 4-epimerase/fuculose-1-phosphate aldolase